MFLQKSQRNKFTIGKTFRKNKGLRKPDPTAEIVPMPTDLQQYTDQLISKGLKVNGLKFAHFKTRNGLRYPGLVATEKIKANTILVKCPVNLLLTTRDAFLSDIQRIFEENPKYFAKRFSSDWEDRILLAYILYENQKGKKSKWFNLIRNLPKDIDYTIFWNQQQIKRLQDKWFEKHIEAELIKFQQDCVQMIKILENYPQFYTKDAISRDNIKWIHTHLVTRCFGKYFEYTTMVPFAQLFNHQCTDVYYSMFYHPDNPHDEHQQFYEEKQLTPEQMDECQSSDGSYDADDFNFNDETIPFSQQYRIQWQQKACTKIQLYKDFRSIRVHLFTFINFSDSVSLGYLLVMLKNMKIALLDINEEYAKQAFEQIHSSNARYIKKVKQFYNKNKRKYYSYAIRQKRKIPIEKDKKDTKAKDDEIVDEPIKGEKYFQNQWPKDKFDQFYMLCSTKDQFQKGSQVFFCYGRLPNKLLLMRYGFALEHNKYDHMFIKIDITNTILNQPTMRQLLAQININKYKRFKVKRTKFCIQLITYFRSFRWSWGQRLQLYFCVSDYNRQKQTLLQTKQFYKEQLSYYSSPLLQNEKKLMDDKLGYHQYFALVYKMEQQRILHQQIRMIQYGITVINKLNNERSLQQILLEEKDPYKLTMQIMMENYFKLFQQKQKQKVQI